MLLVVWSVFRLNIGMLLVVLSVFHFSLFWYPTDCDRWNGEQLHNHHCHSASLAADCQTCSGTADCTGIWTCHYTNTPLEGHHPTAVLSTQPSRAVCETTCLWITVSCSRGCATPHHIPSSGRRCCRRGTTSGHDDGHFYFTWVSERTRLRN